MNDSLINRITFNKEILVGKPIIRGMRLSVEMILELMSKGCTPQDIIEDYPELELNDIYAALLYAYNLVSHEEIYTRTGA